MVAGDVRLDLCQEQFDAEYVTLVAGYVVISLRYFGTDLWYFKDALRDESNDLWNGSKPHRD